MKLLHVFTIPNTPEAFFDGQFAYLARKDHDITVFANSALSKDFCVRNRVKSKIFPVARSIDLFADIKAILILRSDIKKNKFDVVVGHTPKGAMVAMIAAKLAGVRTRVYYRHGLIYTTATGLKRKIFKFVEQFTAACSTHIVNVSPSLCRLSVIDHLNSYKKQAVIGRGTCGGIDTANTFNPNLVSDAEQSDLKAELGINENNLVVGFCGRICKEKGIRELVDGFKLFNKKYPSSRLLLVGAFDTRDILPEDYRNEVESNPNIISTGRIEKSNLPQYYSLMDVFVFPSYREGFGMSVIEASAMEIPILVSKSHGCIDSIVEGETGEYIDLSPAGIVSGLELMMDKTKREEYGNNGRKWVCENFDWSVLWPKIAEFYASLKR